MTQYLHVDTDERWPTLVLRESDHPLDDDHIPEELVQRFREAQAAFRAAELAIARWARDHGSDEVKSGLRPLIEELPR